MARRDDRAYRAYVSEEQRRQPGCPARELCDASRFQGTELLESPRNAGRRSTFPSNSVASRRSPAPARRPLLIPPACGFAFRVWHFLTHPIPAPTSRTFLEDWQSSTAAPPQPRTHRVGALERPAVVRGIARTAAVSTIPQPSTAIARHRKRKLHAMVIHVHAQQEIAPPPGTAVNAPVHTPIAAVYLVIRPRP